MSLLNRYLQPFVDISKNEHFFVFFRLFSYFFTKIWESADFSTKSGKDFLMNLAFRDFGVNEQSDLSIAKLDFSSNNFVFS